MGERERSVQPRALGVGTDPGERGKGAGKRHEGPLRGGSATWATRTHRHRTHQSSPVKHGSSSQTSSPRPEPHVPGRGSSTERGERGGDGLWPQSLSLGPQAGASETKAAAEVKK